MKKNNYFFRDYKTKTALEKDIKDLIGSYAFNQEFESELLSDLIAQKHYYCSFHGIKALQFKKQKNYNSYDFYGFFTTLGWHKVSWRKCIYPESKELIVKQALRDAIQPYSSERKRQYPICERCFKEPSEETDHIDPEFDVIAKQALETLSDKDWESIMINSFDFSIKEPFRLPENNPALIYTLEAHKTAKLQAVCKKCHNANAKERRKKT
ncbi:hypothetical protein [Nostoc sp. CCY0012]|uniref:hypothetical protein n=1 Tax=Nostoc sp. CCY0012 TaxID=1056123 RepID=UPI0039C6D776